MSLSGLDNTLFINNFPSYAETATPTSAAPSTSTTTISTPAVFNIPYSTTPTTAESVTTAAASITTTAFTTPSTVCTAGFVKPYFLIRLILLLLLLLLLLLRVPQRHL